MTKMLPKDLLGSLEKWIPTREDLVPHPKGQQQYMATQHDMSNIFAEYYRSRIMGASAVGMMSGLR